MPKEIALKTTTDASLIEESRYNSYVGSEFEGNARTRVDQKDWGDYYVSEKFVIPA